MSDITLLPCPFCGAEAKLRGGPMAQETYSVWCIGKARHHLDALGYDEAAAVAAWNTRPAAQPATVTVEEAFVDAVETIALALFNEHRTSRGMSKVDYIGANQTPDANHFRKLAEVALRALAGDKP